ncbi:NACHT domain-containing protein [Alteromonas sp. a30]|uniref:NACHT domain-containing protein n=1 Tax=Alteromonas sp. a30 TaxID=2730917 RepID=UPI00227FD2F9|nr:NACHT domain-containing protein [Alteromonas sp. a30]MCY7295054.1 NACHT domain-containing protein [Alteromonas sp. a30]
MMKLRITDNFPEDTICIELTESNTTEQFTSEPFVSPFSQAFLANFTKLFSSSPDEVELKPHSAELMEKFIRLGQHLGDALLGENHTLNKFREIIEEKGYAQCDVSIESSRIAFFELPWEALILPESQFVLATTARSFTRVFTPQNAQSDSLYFPDIQFDLKVTGPTQTQFKQMMGGATPEQQTSEAEASSTPLQILSLCYGQLEQAEVNTEANSKAPEQEIEHTLAFDLLATDTAIKTNIHVFQGLDALKKQLSDNAFHVLSLSGDIALNDAQAFWVSPSDANQRIPMQTLFELMQEFNIPLLVLNINQYLQDQQSISADTGLAFVSYQAQEAGIGNVLGFNQSASAQLRLPCLSQFYRQLTKGLSLAQAVVETRKALQSQQANATSLTGMDTPSWPLLSHYGQQNLVFFASAPPEIEAETALYAQQVHQQLFGFIEEALPPYRISLDNGEFVNALAGLQQQRITCVKGEQGGGKTLLAHQLAFYAVESKCYQWAFRFDFSKHEYQANDILQMIAPVLQIDAAQEALSALQETRCLFVFDGLNSPQTQAQLAELITTLTTQQQGVLITQHSSANVSFLKDNADSNLVQLAIAQLSQAQCLTLTLTQLAQSQAQQGQQTPEALTAESVKQLTQLLQQAQLNPWLGIRLGNFLGSSASQPSDLEKAIRQLAPQWQNMTQCAIHDGAVQNNSIKENYYQWQWLQLTESAQQLLLICSQFDESLLEMLMVAWERETDISQPLSALLAQPVFNDAFPHFSAMIKQWQRQGFIKMRPHGHVIDADCVHFLAQKRADAQWLQNPALQTQVSRLLCAGLRILADHVLRQQNPAIFRNLLNNRALWAKHLKTLWHSECFAEFIKTKATVSQLMQQAQLGQEFAMWAHKLTQEIAIPLIDESSPEACIAWLSLATSALDAPNTTDSTKNKTDAFAHAAEQAKQWLLSTRATAEQKLSAPQLALMQHANQFLGSFYAANADWEKAIACHLHTAESFKTAQAWPLLASVLSTLANTYVRNQQNDAARECEQRILTELPYEHAPKGYRSQKLVDVILSRIQRGDIEHIPALLNELKSSEDANRWQDFIKGVEADIDFAQERWEKALPYYAKMWQQALQSQQIEQANVLQQRLNTLESHLGKDTFSSLLAQVLEEGQTP